VYRFGALFDGRLAAVPAGTESSTMKTTTILLVLVLSGTASRPLDFAVPPFDAGPGQAVAYCP